jgi:hypothetical protein
MKEPLVAKQRYQKMFDNNTMGFQESKDRLAYCDIQLESVLIHFGTWLAGQYGGDRAYCNPLE